MTMEEPTRQQRATTVRSSPFKAADTLVLSQASDAVASALKTINAAVKSVQLQTEDHKALSAAVRDPSNPVPTLMTDPVIDSLTGESYDAAASGGRTRRNRAPCIRNMAVLGVVRDLASLEKGAVERARKLTQVLHKVKPELQALMHDVLHYLGDLKHELALLDQRDRCRLLQRRCEEEQDQERKLCMRAAQMEAVRERERLSRHCHLRRSGALLAQDALREAVRAKTKELGKQPEEQASAEVLALQERLERRDCQVGLLDSHLSRMADAVGTELYEEHHACAQQLEASLCVLGRQIVGGLAALTAIARRAPAA